MNYTFQIGKLNDLQRQGIISLKAKPNKNTAFVTNWRPISLMKVDYKKATKALASRLKKVIGTLITKLQTRFIKARYIGESNFIAKDNIIKGYVLKIMTKK